MSRNGNERRLGSLALTFSKAFSTKLSSCSKFLSALGFQTFSYLEGYVYFFTPFALKCLLCHIGNCPGGEISSWTS